MALGKHQLGGNDVLSQRPDVLVGGDRRLYLDSAPVDFVDLLDHDHGVELLRERVSGVHPLGLLSDVQGQGGGLGGADGIRGPDRNAVHGSGVVVRRGYPGPDRLRRRPAQGRVQGDVLRRHQGRRAHLTEGRVEPVDRLVQGDVAEVVPPAVLSTVHGMSVYGVAGRFRTVSPAPCPPRTGLPGPGAP